MAELQRKIFLIGYRATGKTTVGRLVAEQLCLPFMDMDKVIEQQSGRTISAMVAGEGWEAFRARERVLLAATIAGDPAVVATGGGAVLHQELWPRIKQENLVVWLTADAAAIGERLTMDGNTASQRPSLTGQDVQAEITAVLREREPLYRASANLTIDTTATPLRTVVEQIIAAYRRALST